MSSLIKALWPMILSFWREAGGTTQTLNEDLDERSGLLAAPLNAVMGLWDMHVMGGNGDPENVAKIVLEGDGIYDLVETGDASHLAAVAHLVAGFKVWMVRLERMLVSLTAKAGSLTLFTEECVSASIAKFGYVEETALVWPIVYYCAEHDMEEDLMKATVLCGDEGTPVSWALQEGLFDQKIFPSLTIEADQINWRAMEDE